MDGWIHVDQLALRDKRDKQQADEEEKKENGRYNTMKYATIRRWIRKGTYVDIEVEFSKYVCMLEGNQRRGHEKKRKKQRKK